MKQLRKLGFVGAIALLAQVSWGQGAVRGSGTPNVIPIWTTGTMIGNSLLSQSGSSVNVNGSITAASFAGAGSGLTLLNPANISVGTANISIAGNAATATNSTELNGLQASAFARLSFPNIFTTDQTIQGNLSLTGNLTMTGSVNNALILQGNLVASNGHQGANVIGGFGGNSSFPGNSVASFVLGATIAGGGGMFLADVDSPVPGPNVVTGSWGTVGGGFGNSSFAWATVAGGDGNAASGLFSSVAGGQRNSASGGEATVAGGGGNTASGINAIVAGGQNNTAGGINSFAAGTFANAADNGSFVWGDNTTSLILPPLPLSSTGPNSFVARATGGFTFYTAVDSTGNPTTGAALPSGSGSWSSVSIAT